MSIRNLKPFLLFVVLLFTEATSAQVIFTYGKNTTTSTDFLKAYNKNNSTVVDKEKSIREYLNLYSNFKLKVAAAKDLKLDTLDQLKYDVKNFRDQIIENYLVDNKSMQLLINEAINRSSKDIEVLYYFIPFGADSNLAKKNAFELSDQLNKGNKREDVVNSFVALNPKIKHFNIGYITTFSVNYDFENIIYNTKLGTASMPLQNTKGFHIFLPINERAAVGKWNVAQILFAFPPNTTPENKSKIKSLADSVYTLLKNGLPFADAAKKYSDDRLTNQNGGVIQEFGTGKYTTSYEEKIFTIKNDNEICLPFETDYGYHIVKRINQKKVITNLNDLNNQAEIKGRILQDSRKEKEALVFKKSIETITGFKTNNLKDKLLLSIADTFNKNNASSFFDKNQFASNAIASFKDGSKIKITDWIKYLKSFYSNPEHPQIKATDLLKSFYYNSVIDKYKSNLENYNEDFKYQMQEFIDGNLMFEIMDRNVWSKAGTDKITLQEYYDSNKQKYTWDSSANVIFFNCSNFKTAEKAIDLLLQKNDWKTVVDSLKDVQIDSARYELGQLTNFTQAKRNNLILSNIVNNTEGSATFIQYLNFYSANQPRSFNDAKGLVTNDYQQLLEQKWIETLQKKYPIKYNEAAIKAMIKKQ